MVGRLFGALTALFVYFCVATIFAQLISLGYLFAMGRIDRDRLVQIAAVAQGVDLLSVKTAVETRRDTGSKEQMAFRNVQQARAVAENDFRLREQALARESQNIRRMREVFASEQTELQRVSSAFEERLAAISDQAANEGQENVRLILENVKPAQAKQQIMRMVDAGEIAEVVQMIANMTINSKKKIIAEFKDGDEDEETLQEILNLLRRGVPRIDVIRQAQDELGTDDSVR